MRRRAFFAAAHGPIPLFARGAAGGVPTVFSINGDPVQSGLAATLRGAVVAKNRHPGVGIELKATAGPTQRLGLAQRYFPVQLLQDLDAELRVEQPTRFQFVAKRRAARTMAPALPPSPRAPCGPLGPAAISQDSHTGRAGGQQRTAQPVAGTISCLFSTRQE